MTFEDFKFSAAITEGLAAMNYQKPTPVQEEAIPKILANKDMIACAQTGTGKTAAYLLPILQKISTNTDENYINTLVISPTRELAQQIDNQLEGFAYFAPVSSIAIYGGSDGTIFEKEKKALVKGAEIIIATPGRLMSHINLGYVNFSKLKHLVLDEADKMLDMGFFDDIMKIISHLPKQRQTLLFSATMPEKIKDLAKKILTNPEFISLAVSKPAENVLQGAYFLDDKYKTELVKQLVIGKNLKSIIIFSSTKANVKIIERELLKSTLTVGAIHSDLEQTQRETVMNDFRNRKIQLLVATDIVSRGIDIDSIDLVINYDVPSDAEDYIHRIGRTARAEASGIAITFVNNMDRIKFDRIEKFLGDSIKNIPLPEGIPNISPFVASRDKKTFYKGKGPKRH